MVCPQVGWFRALNIRNRSQSVEMVSHVNGVTAGQEPYLLSCFGGKTVWKTSSGGILESEPTHGGGFGQDDSGKGPSCR